MTPVEATIHPLLAQANYPLFNPLMVKVFIILAKMICSIYETVGKNKLTMQ